MEDSPDRNAATHAERSAGDIEENPKKTGKAKRTSRDSFSFIYPFSTKVLPYLIFSYGGSCEDVFYACG